MRALCVSITVAVVMSLVPSASAVTTTRTGSVAGFISLSRSDFACLGERVTFTGKVHITSRVTESSGTTSTMFLIALRHVVGTGAETGRTYHIVGTYKALDAPNGTLVQWTFNVVGGQGPRILGRLTMNRHGDVVSQRYLCI